MTKSLQPVIDALKSGKYVKGQNLLHYFDKEKQVDRFCCLGVLCEVEHKPWEHHYDTDTKIEYALKVPNPDWDSEYYEDEEKFSLHEGELPTDLSHEYGLRESIDEYPDLKLIADMFAVISYSYDRTLEALLIAVNDGTDEDRFKPVIAVLETIEKQRNTTGYYGEAQANVS